MPQENLYQRPEYPVLVVISGPSGVGKDTIARQLIATQPQKFHFVVTATTRPPRVGEVEGYDYFFVTSDQFAAMIENDELLEYAVVDSDYKGIPKQQIRDALDSGRDVIMRLDIQGAATVRKLIPNCISIFLVAESEASLLQRLQERKSETPEGLNLRIATARQEMKQVQAFDYCVVNAAGRQEETVDRILAIVKAAHSRVHQHPVRLK